MNERKTISLRISAELHERIARAASDSGRSLTGEIVARMTQSLNADEAERDPKFRAAVREELMEFLRERPELIERWSGVSVRREGEPLQPINQHPDDDEGKA